MMGLNIFSVVTVVLIILLKIGLYNSLENKYQVLLALAQNPKKKDPIKLSPGKKVLPR